MTDLTKICFVRHGETDWNAERRMQGHIDIPLNETGIRQAQQLCNTLLHTNHHFHHIYSSDLMRAFNTAKVIADGRGLDIVVHADLRERHVGQLQGLLLHEAPHRVPQVWQRHVARELDYDLEGGESIVHFHERVQRMLAHFLQQHRGEHVLAVSHGGTLDMVYRVVTGQSLSAERVAVVPNTSLNWISHDGNAWSIERWGDTSHLQDAALGNIEI